MASKKLIVIVGPTAVGKTKLAVQLAKLLQTEIISADSRQFYEKLDIGTAKPTAKEMQNIPHHFIDNKILSAEYSCSQFEKEALLLLDQKFDSLNEMIMVGGSGLYVQAVCEGFDTEIPTSNREIREKLAAVLEKDGLGKLQEMLLQLDRDFYAQVDINNPIRVMRAIEVCRITGKKYSELRKGKGKERGFDCIKIGLELPREELYERINQRVDEMLDQGLEQEARNVMQFKKNNALKTVGYKEFFSYFEGRLTKEEAIEKIKTNSRRYAKKQMTWFKKDGEINWFHPDDVDKIITFIHSKSY